MSPHALNKQKAQRVQYGVFPLCNIHCMLSYEMVLHITPVLHVV